MIDDKEMLLLLALQTEFKVSKQSIKNYFATHGNLEEVKKLESIKSIINESNQKEITEKLNKKGIKFIALCEKEYPEKLRQISDPPYGLFYKGNLTLLNAKSVAIVGTRNPTNYGISITKKIASLLAKENISVISGLASGIDSCAHKGVFGYGKTIAVLGTGVDVIFPASNKELYNEILQKDNLIISEYPPGSEGLPWNFPQRNRIISALSDAVIVIEGDVQSGALITARFAIKQDKPLFALPGPIDSPMSNGPNILIKSKVAELLTSVSDVLEKIGSPKQVKLDFSNNEETIDKLSKSENLIYKLISEGTGNFDTLIQKTNLDVQDLLKHLSILELKGLVEKAQNGNYVKI